MKNTLTVISQLSVFFGLPATFVAAAFHTAPPLAGSRFYQWLARVEFHDATLLFPVLFFAVVMSVAVILVHNLRCDQDLARVSRLSGLPRQAGLPLQKKTKALAKPVALSHRKPTSTLA